MTMKEFKVIDQFGGQKATNVIYSSCGKFQIFATKTHLLVYSNQNVIHKHQFAGIRLIQATIKNQVMIATISSVILYDFVVGLELHRKELENVTLMAQSHLIQDKTLLKYNQTYKKLYRMNIEVKKMCFNKDCSMAVLVCGLKTMFFMNMNDFSLKEVKTPLEITSIAVSPVDGCVAVGNVDGQIILYYSAKDSRILHWHAQSVTALAFTNDGYLLSGGLESTLVIWQLESGRKQFIPRLGATISDIAISPDYSEYMLTLKDNSILFVNATDTNDLKYIYGLQCTQLGENYRGSIGLVRDPRTGYVAMNGSPGKLQIIDHSGNTKNQIDLASRNTFVTDNKTTVLPHITHTCYSPKGDWMVTVEQRNGFKEIFMRFWQFNESKQQYTLNTRIDFPHTKKVTDLKFSPTDMICASIGRDGSLKIWELVLPDTIEKTPYWRCKSEGLYKNIPGTSLSFSDDGSTLAAAFEKVITLWDPLSNRMVKQLSFTGYKTEAIVQVKFLNMSPYLVSITKSYLHVWDLLSCSVLWSSKITCGHLALDPYSSNFLVSAKLGKGEYCLYYFNPLSCAPISITKLEASAKGLLILENVDQSPEFLVLDSNFDMFKFKEQINEPTPTILEQARQSTNFFESLYGSSVFETRENETIEIHNIEKIEDEKLQLFQAPSYMLPKPSRLANTFLESFLTGNSEFEEVVIEEKAEEDSDEIEIMDEVDLEDDEEIDIDEAIDIEPISSFDFLDDLMGKMVVSEPARQVKQPVSKENQSTPTVAKVSKDLAGRTPSSVKVAPSTGKKDGSKKSTPAGTKETPTLGKKGKKRSFNQ